MVLLFGLVIISTWFVIGFLVGFTITSICSAMIRRNKSMHHYSGAANIGDVPLPEYTVKRSDENDYA